MKRANWLVLPAVLALVAVASGQQAPVVNPRGAPGATAGTVVKEAVTAPAIPIFALPEGAIGGLPIPGMPDGPTMVFRGELAPEKQEKAAFLGLFVHAASDDLRSQLKLPDHTGLVVERVEPGSPAETAGFKDHDVLEKLEDQLVIDTYQFAVLVRLHKAGDTVNFRVIRQGQPTSVKATLVEKEMPVLHERAEAPLAGELGNAFYLTGAGGNWENLPAHRRALFNGQRSIMLSDEGQTKTLTVKDLATGKTLFDGPVQTETQRQALPEDIRKDLQTIETELVLPEATREVYRKAILLRRDGATTAPAGEK